jgi:hypothetical protein
VESKQLTTGFLLTTKTAVDVQEFKSACQLHKPGLTLRPCSFSASRFGSSLMFGRKIAPHTLLLSLQFLTEVLLFELGCCCVYSRNGV